MSRVKRFSTNNGYTFNFRTGRIPKTHMFHQPSHIHVTLPKWLESYADTYMPSSSLNERMMFVIEASRRNVEEGSGGPFAAALFRTHRIQGHDSWMVTVKAMSAQMITMKTGATMKTVSAMRSIKCILTLLLFLIAQYDRIHEIRKSKASIASRSSAKVVARCTQITIWMMPIRLGKPRSGSPTLKRCGRRYFLRAAVRSAVHAVPCIDLF
jgi:hypothetical protein